MTGFVLATCLALCNGAAIAAAKAKKPTPRQQFDAAIKALQADPADAVARERALTLAPKLKPAPKLPEEAERRMVRGKAALREARAPADFRAAAAEFEQAANAAPWYADAYFQLGAAQDKAGDYAAAVASLKLALLAAPANKETRSLLYEVEYRQDKANAQQQQQAQSELQKRAQDEARLQRLEGGRWVFEMRDAANALLQVSTVEVRGRQATWSAAGHGAYRGNPEWSDSKTCTIEGLHCDLGPNKPGNLPGRYFLDFSEDGKQVDWTFQAEDKRYASDVRLHQRR